jgi:hypothetical protein
MTEEPTYEQIKADGVHMCGNAVAATAFFTSFMVLGAVIFLNMFIAIILEGFEYSQQEESMRINDFILEKFINCWKKYDLLGTSMIDIKDLEELICDLLEEELKQKGTTKKACFFHLSEDHLLVLHVKIKREREIEDPRMAEMAMRPTV